MAKTNSQSASNETRFKLWDGTAENVLVENIRTKIDYREILPPGDEKNVEFISNPKIVEFKNYYLKKSYSKNIMLTNVSSLTSNIRLVEISNEIKDVCSLDFTPLSATFSGNVRKFQVDISSDKC